MGNPGIPFIDNGADLGEAEAARGAVKQTDAKRFLERKDMR